MKMLDIVTEEKFNEGIDPARRVRRRKRVNLSKKNLAKKRLEKKSKEWNADRKVRVFRVRRHMFTFIDEVVGEVHKVDNCIEGFGMMYGEYFDSQIRSDYKIGSRTYSVDVQINPIR